jgi:glycerol-3-phosphate dehydrogenase subunit C
MSVIKGTPGPGLCYTPTDPNYWDQEALGQELDRAFDICNGCRLCFNLCPSFPALFEAVERHEGDVRKFTPEDTGRIIDTCFQCKICYVKCPYTPDDGHQFQLDFPRLMMRANAVRKKKTGLDLRARLLSRPERLGRMAGMCAGMANWANRQPVLRAGLQAALGIHKDKILPSFHGETFEDWYRKQPAPAGDPSRAVLFYTCSVNFNEPQVGKDAVDVFARNGIALTCPKQNCCGMPALEAGDVELAQKLARQNIDTFLPHVRAGRRVIAIDPTCSYMLRKEYPVLVATPEARELSAATRDLCEFLFELKREGTFNRDFRSTPGRVGYHVPCHLRAQNIGYRSRDMMKLIPGASIRMIEQCSGHDGTWAMKKEFFPLSMLTGRKAFDLMKEAEPEVMASDCPLASIQFEQALGTRPMHPIQVLARAYRPDGFPQSLEEQKP